MQYPVNLEAEINENIYFSKRAFNHYQVSFGLHNFTSDAWCLWDGLRVGWVAHTYGFLSFWDT